MGSLGLGLAILIQKDFFGLNRIEVKEQRKQNTKTNSQGTQSSSLITNKGPRGDKRNRNGSLDLARRQRSKLVVGNKILPTESMRRVIGYLLLTQFIAIHIHSINVFFPPPTKKKQKNKNNNNKQMR